MTFRAGIIGCGRIGCAFDDDPRRGYVSTHAGAYVRTPGVELVALADVDGAKLDRYGEKFGVAARYTDYHEMLDRERLDIVSVCTWNNTHLDIVRAAVARGVKAVFCEKPIADSLSAADEIIRLCAGRNVMLMVDYPRRFDRFHREVATFLQKGGLGQVQQVTGYYTAGVANTGSHLFDLLRFYLGDPAWVQGRHSSSASPNPGDPNIDGWLGFPGCVAAVQACDVRAYLIFEVVLLGIAGRLRITSSGFAVEFEEVRESERFAGYRELRSAPPPVRVDGPREFMLAAVAHLVTCLETSQRPFCSGEDGRAALEMVCALRESADAGGMRVDLPMTRSVITIQSR